MDHALLVREDQAVGRRLRDVEAPTERQCALRVLEQTLDVAPTHQLGDDVGHALVVSEVEDGNDVRVHAHAAHRLRLAHHTLTANLIEALRLDQRERDVAVEQLVVREVDALLAALSEEALHPVAPAREGVGLDAGSRGLRRVRRRRSGCVSGRDRAEVRLGHLQEGERIVVRVVDGLERRERPQLLSPTHGADEAVVGLVEQGVDAPLDAFARHGSRDDTAVCLRPGVALLRQQWTTPIT